MRYLPFQPPGAGSSSSGSSSNDTENAVDDTRASSTADTKDSVNLTDSYATSEVGDVITFGTWEQDASESDGAEPIEWIVLDKNSKGMTVISKYILENQSFQDLSGSQDENSSPEHCEVTWENSGVRTWLNDTFFNTAFTDDEKVCIMDSEVPAAFNMMASNYNVSGNDTVDKIYILSVHEAEKYFTDNDSRIAECTEYAKNRNDVQSYNVGTWLLRTSIIHHYMQCYVWTTGNLDTYTGINNTCACGIRPVMKLTLPEGTVAAETDRNTEELTSIADAAVGDTVSFGAYDLDADSTTPDKSIQWQILEKTEDSALLFSSQILIEMPFIVDDSHEPVAIVTNYEDSVIRQWLNHYLLTVAFTDDEKEAICLTTVIQDANPQYDSTHGSDTEDRIFLLSAVEVQKYLSEESKASAAGDWVLRTMGQSASYAAYVEADGNLNLNGHDVDTGVGVRPALWVKFK